MKANFTYNKYITIYIIGMSIFGSLLAMNYLFLRNSGELLNEQQIYKLQNEQTTPILYGSGIFNSSDSLRIYSYGMKKPKIIALGSSRVLEFRQKFFTQSFYNLGTTVQNVDDAVNTVDKLLAQHIPEVIIFGVDFWWFNDQNTRPEPLSTRYKHEIDPGHLLKPFTWIREKKVSLKQYLNLQINKGNQNIGVKGKINLSGIGADGSYYKTDTVSVVNPNFNEIEFKYTVDSIKSGTNRFIYGTYASDQNIKKFADLITSLEAKGIKVALFFPPLPEKITSLMQQYNYAYINDLKDKFNKLNLQYTDYTAAHEVIDTNDCEFVDGYHGGDILYAKMLSHLTRKNKLLDAYVDTKYLEHVALMFPGLTMIPDSNISNKPEVDFLCMGCKKSYEPETTKRAI